MDIRKKLSDSEIERLLAGRAPAVSEGPSGGMDDLARFIRGARSAWSVEPTQEAAAAHVTKAAETAAAAADGLNPPAVANRRRFPRFAARSEAPRSWRRRTVVSTLFASLTAKVAGVALAATVATTGALAATGTLPAPAQQAVASVAAKVGVSIPDGHHHPGSDADGVTSTVTSTVTPDVTETADGDVTGTVTSTATDSVVNHGNCVSWVAQMASTLGFTGSEHGALVSTIAKDSAAVSGPVAPGGVPGAACQAEIAKAVAALHPATPTSTATSGNNGKGNSGSHGNSSKAPGHNKSTPTSTATSGTAGSDGSDGSSSNPSSNPGHH